MPTLKKRIEIAMLQSGVTQTQIAAACGIKVPSVNGWTSGKTKHLKAETALKAAKFLGVNPTWLAEGRGPMAPEIPIDLSNAVVLTPEEHRLIHAFHRLENKDQKKFIVEAEYKAALADLESLDPKDRLSA